MISITCTQCRTVLTIDDAFAGGVCRCQHCGTIQTVPSALKPAATHTPKSLYQNTSARSVAAGGGSGQSPSGLDDLATAVTSSGLTGSGLRSSPDGGDGAIPATPEARGVTYAPEATTEETRKKKSMLPLMLGAGLVVLAGVGITLFLLFRGGSGGSGGAGGSGGGTFCGVPLAGSTSVVYVLDRASSIRGDFDPLKAATLHSVSTLGADRKFAVILWNNGGDDVAFPAEGLRNATSDQVEQCKSAISDVVATGSSRLTGALERAIARQPSTIVIATSKSKFDEDDVKVLSNVRDATGGKIKFYTIIIAGSGENDVLKLASQATGGQFKAITSKELQAATP